MLVFKDLQDEVKRRALRNQAGDEYDEQIKNIINTSLFRIAREARWRCLRRKAYFTTKSTYSSGTNFVAVTNSSTAVSLISTACNLWTDRIEVGRRITFGTDSWDYIIRAINSNTNIVIDLPYRGTTATRTTYSIYPQEEYNLPIQVDHRSFLWHEDYGYPFKMEYIPEQEYIEGQGNLDTGTPEEYRMWGENFVMAQPPTASPLVVTWSSTSDVSCQIVITGQVSGYPNSETLTVGNSITTLQFESVERVSKDRLTYGTLAITSSRGSYTIATLPAGDTTGAVKYSKVQISPLPNRAFDINVYYYKDPYRLVNDDDIHEMGQDFDEAIILFSTAKIKYQESQAEGDRWLQLAGDELRNLKKNNVDKIDWTPTLKRPNSGNGGDYITPFFRRGQAGAYF